MAFEIETIATVARLPALITYTSIALSTEFIMMHAVRVRGSVMKAKSPNAIDVYVGGRVRLRRQLLGMSQSNLADALGITFQQVQKYEKGANRIGASRLQRLADILGVPIGFFFESDPAPSDSPVARAEADQITVFLTSKEGLALSKAFLAIEDANVRQKLLALTRTLGSANLTENDRGGSDPAESTRG